MSRKKIVTRGTVIKSGVWYTISNFVLKGLDFLTIPFFTRLMASEAFGDYNNYVSWVQLIIIISTLSLYTSLFSAQFDFADTLNDYISSLLILGTVNAIFIALVVSMFPAFFENLCSLNIKLIYYILVYAAVRPAFDIYQQQERLFYRYKKSVILTIITTVSTLATSFLLVICMRDKFIGRAVGAYLSFIFIGIVLYIIFFLKGHDIKFKYMKYALKICIPFVPHLLAMTVLSSTDRIMIRRICGSSETALYSLAYTCALAISVLWTSLNSAFAPWLGDMLHEKKHEIIRNRSKQYALIFALPTVIIIIFAPELLYILGGKEYISAKYVMPPVLLGCFFQFLYSMYVNIEQFCKKTVGMAVASVSAAIINIILNAIFIPIFGYVAAAYTTLIGYIFLMLFHYFLVKRIGLTQVYDTKYFIYIIFFEIITIIIATVLYRYNVVRWCIGIIVLLFIMLFVLKNRDMIIGMLKK